MSPDYADGITPEQEEVLEDTAPPRYNVVPLFGVEIDIPLVLVDVTDLTDLSTMAQELHRKNQELLKMVDTLEKTASEWEEMYRKNNRDVVLLRCKLSDAEDTLRAIPRFVQAWYAGRSYDPR